jgi:hypothetical protein
VRVLSFRLPKVGNADCQRAAWVGLLLVLIFIFLPPSVPARKQTKEDIHIAIIRKLGSEIAVVKVPLPRGKRGIFLNAKGEIDQKDADAEMRLNGPAIRAGMPVEITKISFKSEKIIFEINGGGKSRKKWYQHIEIGMGNTTRPISQQPPVLTYGSWITLNLPGKMKDFTSDQIKKMLDPVLDFNRQSPTVLYSPSVPPKFKEAIEKHQVLVGMDRDAVLSSKGPPDRKVREVRNGDEQEDWIYGLPPHVLFVTFDGDTVVSVHQY